MKFRKLGILRRIKSV